MPKYLFFLTFSVLWQVTLTTGHIMYIYTIESEWYKANKISLQLEGDFQYPNTLEQEILQ